MPPGPHAGNRSRPAYSGQPRFRFPKQVIQLFAPRKPLDFKPPPRKRKLRPLTGLAQFISRLEPTKPTPSQPESSFRTPAQTRQLVKTQRLKKVDQAIANARNAWQPAEDSDNEKSTSNKTSDPYNTLFVYNVPRTALNMQLQDLFEAFGPVRTVIMPQDRQGLPRGYAFVEFERERDAQLAIKQAGDLRIDGRWLKLDVERGRTVKGWYPNRLDGPNNSCSSRYHRRRRQAPHPPK